MQSLKVCKTKMEKQEFMDLSKKEKLGFLEKKKKGLQKLRKEINQKILELSSELK